MLENVADSWPSGSARTASLVLFALAVGGVASPALGLADSPNFDEQIKPIFREACAGCHNPATARGGLDLTTYNGIMKGGSSGEVVAAGDPDGSTLLQLIAHEREPHMPPNAPKRADDELELLRQWISGGLLERKGGVARAAAQSSLNLAAAPTMKRPDGPPILPAGLPLQPVSKPSRSGPVTAIAASPWAPVVALGGARQISLYNTETLELLGILQFPEGQPQTLKFSRNGKLLICGGGVGARSGHVLMWDVASGRQLGKIGDETDAVLAADISPDQNAIALGGPPRLVRVYGSADGGGIRDIKKHTDWVTAVEYSPDGVLLATGDRGGGLVLWEASSGEEFQLLQGHQAAISDVSWRGDADVLASASEDGTIRLWNPADGKQIRQWRAHDGGVLAIDYSRDGKIVSCGRDRRVRVWDGGGKQIRAIEGFQDTPLSIAVADGDKRAIVGDSVGGVTVIDIAAGERCGALLPNPPTLAETIEQAESEMAAAQEKIDALEQEVGETEAAAKNQAAALAAIRQRATEAEQKLKDIDSRVAGLAKGDAALSAELQNARTALSRKQEELAAVTDRRKKEAARLASMTSSLASLEITIAEQRKKIPVSPAVNVTANGSSAPAADAPNADLVAELHKNLKVAGDTRAQMDKAKAAVRDMDATIAKLDADAAALRPLMGEKQKLASDSAQELAEAKKLRQPAAGTLDEVAREVATETGKTKSAAERLEASRRSLDQARREISIAQARLIRARDAQFDQILEAASRRVAPNAKEAPPIGDLMNAVHIGLEKVRPSDLRPDTNAFQASHEAPGADAQNDVPLAAPPWFFVGRFHLVLLHLPIGLLLAAFLFEMDYLWRRRAWCGRFAGQLLILGAATACLTAIAGLLLSLEPGYAPADIATHKWLGIAAAVGAAGAALIRRFRAAWAKAAYWSLFAQMIVCTVLAGHAGGELTHGEGFLVRYFPDWLASSTASRTAVSSVGDSPFETEIQPILEGNCQSCHGPQRQSGGLRLDSLAAATSGGKSGFPAIVPGKALESELVRRVLLSRNHDETMPPSSKPAMSDEDIMALIRWINGGAPWPKQRPATAHAAIGLGAR